MAEDATLIERFVAILNEHGLEPRFDSEPDCEIDASPNAISVTDVALQSTPANS
jgi:hypothetical protein